VAVPDEVPLAPIVLLARVTLKSLRTAGSLKEVPPASMVTGVPPPDNPLAEVIQLDTDVLFTVVAVGRSAKSAGSR
jgi:hypothetical protein